MRFVKFILFLCSARLPVACLNATGSLLGLFVLGLCAHAVADSESAGDWLLVALPSASLYYSERLREDRQGSYQLLAGLSSATLSALALKSAISKTRPDGECCDAFPSGHAAISFADAAFMQRRYGWRQAAPAWLAASYVGYSRVRAKRHSEGDVVAGAVLGALNGYLWSSRYPSGLSLTPQLGHRQWLLALDYRW